MSWQYRVIVERSNPVHFPSVLSERRPRSAGGPALHHRLGACTQFPPAQYQWRLKSISRGLGCFSTQERVLCGFPSACASHHNHAELVRHVSSTRGVSRHLFFFVTFEYIHHPRQGWLRSFLHPASCHSPLFQANGNV